MPSVVERVRACGLPPPAGISYALNTPDWSLVTRIERSSGENDAPNIAVVFMNCSIVYWGTGRARCAAAAPGRTLAHASTSGIRRRDGGEVGQRTGRSGGGRCNLPRVPSLSQTRDKFATLLRGSDRRFRSEEHTSELQSHHDL